MALVCAFAFMAGIVAAAETPAAAPAAAAAVATAATVLEVSAEPLSAAAFKPFGQVIEVPEGQKPTLQTQVLRYWGGLAKDRFPEEVEFGMLSMTARPREVAELERHIRSPECLVGLSGEWWLVVAPPTIAGRPLLASRVKVFLVRPGQAVLLHKGTWHADPFPKGETGLFLVAFRDGSFKKDLKIKAFKGKEAVRIP